VALDVVAQAAPLGFAARPGARAEPGDFAAVVASLGHDDEGAVREALAAGCEYVGLVASRKRGAAVLEALRAEGVAEADLARVRTPAGVDIGARTHAEIALAESAAPANKQNHEGTPKCAGPIATEYAPMPRKPAWPRLTCPAKPMSRLRPATASARMKTSAPMR